MKQIRYIHKLRICIPIPEDLIQRQRNAQKLNQTFKNVLLTNSNNSNNEQNNSKYSDEEVYKAISQLTKIGNISNLKILNKEKNDIELLRDIQNPSNSFENRINNLSHYLNNNEKQESKYLPNQFIIEKSLVPYDELCRINNDYHSRLSVTKILPKAYCELKDMYQLFIGGINIETKAMVSGRKIHKVLEEQIHPQIDVCLKTKDSDEVVQIDKQKDLIDVDVSIKEEGKEQVNKEENKGKLSEELVMIDITDYKISTSSQLYKISQNIVRIINIFKFGKSREILVHILINKKTGEIMRRVPDGGFVDKEHIIISGIVDDLHLSSEHDDAFKTFQKELTEEINKSFDFENTFQAINSKIESWTDLDDPALYLIVNDDKSRSSKFLPSNDYQKSQLLQVGMYRYFLGNLSHNLNFTYESWRFNMITRGESIDDQLDNSDVCFSYFANHYLLNDYIKLKNGEPLDFNGIKSPPISTAIKSSPYIFVNKTNDKSLDVLVGEWKNPPTFAHILARLSQVEYLLNKFISNKLEITYIDRSSGTKLNVIHDEYNEKYVENQIHLGMNLWMGKREPYPTNSKQVCKNCDFRVNCKIPDRLKGIL